MFADVLVAVDGRASGAVDHAVSIAATYGATLHALSIRDGAAGTDTGGDETTPGGGDTPSVALERRCVRENVPFVRAAVPGDPATAVLRYVREAGVDLVVTGTRHRGRLSRLLGGGAAERISAAATVPVLVITAAAAGTRPPYRRVLLATDGQAGSRRAEACALDLAAAYGAELHGLYVVDSQFGESGALHGLLDREAGPIERGLRTRAAREGVAVAFAVREGRPAHQILDYAGANDVDLIVVGTQGRAGIERVLMGSVARRVLDGASVPVLTARVTESAPRAGG